jgi:hypothetical protein
VTPTVTKFKKKSSGRNSKVVPGAFVTSVEGFIMPVFTFEKISPPPRLVHPSAPAVEKPRGVIVQILDRFVEARVKRTIIDEKVGNPRLRKPAK